jgi:hypothetical protein
MIVFIYKWLENAVFFAGLQRPCNFRIIKDPTDAAMAVSEKTDFWGTFMYKCDLFTKTGSGQTWGNLKKDAVFEPFVYKCDLFTETGSGQTWGNLTNTLPFSQGMVVVAGLNGPVAIMSKENAVVSLIEVGQLIGDQGSKHPHDAIFLPNGDVVVGTWNPGYVSYWKRL